MIDGLLDPLQLAFVVVIVGVVLAAGRWFTPQAEFPAPDTDTLPTREQEG